MADLALRVASGGDDCQAIFHMLMEMHKEVGRAEKDLRKGTWEIDSVVNDHVAWMVEDEGKLIASAGIVSYEPWYSTEPAFTEHWFYVSPEYRTDGRAFRLILAELRALVNKTGTPAMITYFNPKRPARQNSLTSIGEKIFITTDDARPAGEVVLLTPKAG